MAASPTKIKRIALAEEIRKVLRDLDVVPRQVVIEVLIAEVNLNKGMNLGISSTFSDNIGGVPTPIASSTPAPSGSTGAAAALDQILQTATSTDMAKRFVQVRRGSPSSPTRAASASRRRASAGRVGALASPHVPPPTTGRLITIGEEIPVLTSQANSRRNPGANGQTALVNSIARRA
jgi:general secretion pathway protein D